MVLQIQKVIAILIATPELRPEVVKALSR